MNKLTKTGLATAAVSALLLSTAGVASAGVRGDNDRDGIPNRFEKSHGLNPNNAKDAKKDFDRDGLSNLAEYKKHTKIRDADTDNDVLKDGFEVKASDTDPRDADSDDDTLEDGEELDNDTDPNDDDSDDDGVEDGDDAEQLFGTISSFDAATGVLTVVKVDGTTVTGTVNSDTEIELEYLHDDSADHSDDFDNFRSGSDEDDEGSFADLVAGVQVEELEFEGNTHVIEEIELLR